MFDDAARFGFDVDRGRRRCGACKRARRCDDRRDSAAGEVCELLLQRRLTLLGGVELSLDGIDPHGGEVGGLTGVRGFELQVWKAAYDSLELLHA